MTDPLKRPPLSSVLLSEGLDNNLSVGCAKRQKLGQNVIVTNTPHTPTIDVEAVYEELACGICMALSHRPTSKFLPVPAFGWVMLVESETARLLSLGKVLKGTEVYPSCELDLHYLCGPSVQETLIESAFVWRI